MGQAPSGCLLIRSWACLGGAQLGQAVNNQCSSSLSLVEGSCDDVPLNTG
jgi:hypothetical protein